MELQKYQAVHKTYPVVRTKCCDLQLDTKLIICYKMTSENFLVFKYYSKQTREQTSRV